MNQDIVKYKNQGGFTLIEIISVLLIFGIIAVVAVVRMNSTTEIGCASQLEVVKAHLRQAQARAMSSGSPWGIYFHPNKKRYYLFSGAANTTPVQLLGEEDDIVDLEQKKSSLRINVPGERRVTFNAYGSPGAVNVVLETHCDSTDYNNIIITKNTGFIP